MKIFLAVLIFTFTFFNLSFGDGNAPSHCECVPSRLCLNYGVDFGKGLIDVRSNVTVGCSASEVCCETPLNKPVESLLSKPSIASECGKIHFKELTLPEESGSSESAFGDFPWMVAILNVEQDGSNNFVQRFVCSGTLIHESVILTAAHCAIKLDLISSKVRTGEWDLNSNSEPQPHQERDVNQIIIHERFNDSTLLNDVAMIVTMEPFVIDSNTNLMCLPQPNEVAFFNSSCLAVGWGKNDLERPSITISEELVEPRMFIGPNSNVGDLTAQIDRAINDFQESKKKFANFVEDARKRWKNKVEQIRAHFQHKVDTARKLHQSILEKLFPNLLPIPQWPFSGKVISAQSKREILKASRLQLVPRLECQTKWRSEANLGGKFVLRDSFVCAKSIDERDNCKGDASLICPVNGKRDRYQMVGIASWGADCKDATPSVFASVGKFRTWIDEQLTFLELELNNVKN